MREIDIGFWIDSTTYLEVAKKNKKDTVLFLTSFWEEAKRSHGVAYGTDCWTNPRRVLVRGVMLYSQHYSGFPVTWLMTYSGVRQCMERDRKLAYPSSI